MKKDQEEGFADFVRAASPRLLTSAWMLSGDPHVAEELWSKLGHAESLAHGPFPTAEEKYLVEDTVEYPIQVNGKVKARVVVPASASPGEVEAAALADGKVAELLNGGTPRKVIVVPGRLVNVVL